jgi:hypothetical protein
MNPYDCCCGSAAPVNVVGSPGIPGIVASAGANAFAITTASFAVPIVGGTVTVAVDSTSWMVVGQAVVIGQGGLVLTNKGPYTFTVTTITDGTHVILTRVASTSDGTSASVDQGAVVSPIGLPGATGAGGVGGSLTASSPANPAGTASVTAVMMGLAGTVTPTTTGRVAILITGMAGNSTIGDGAEVQIFYGTGAAPNNGVAFTGTALGRTKTTIASTAAGKSGFALAFVATGLVVGTAYWIDTALQAVTGGTASLYDVDVVAIEL